MWQRIQTVFLVIVIGSLIASIFFPIWTHTDPLGRTHSLFAFHYTVNEKGVDNTEYFPYTTTAILLIAATTIALIEIRKYKDRVLQMKLGALNSLFMAAAIGSAVFFSRQFIKTFEGGQYGLALLLPGIAVLCNLISNWFIRRDERIVRDSNRLR
jgi:hypothetical protein